jgi:predicted alpha/beta hydrolase family esterase
MQKRAFIIHGYQGYPEEAWLPWLKGELDARGYSACLPRMPNPESPTIAEWVGFIAGLVGNPDNETVMVGHSIGGQAVLRYLERIGAAGNSVGRTVIAASGFPPGLSLEEAMKMAEGDQVLLPWLTVGVDPKPVRAAAGACTVILSDDDPYIEVGSAEAAFREALDPHIVIEHCKGHLNDDSGLTELPSALRAVIS